MGACTSRRCPPAWTTTPAPSSTASARCSTRQVSAGVTWSRCSMAPPSPPTPCSSSAVLPEIKEYERTSTTVINTYVLSIVQRYLATLRSGLDGIAVRGPLLIMQSNGGLMTDAAAAARPMHIIESGPAAGVVGAQALARRIGFDKLITFDMGGTTAKASLVEDGTISRATEYQVGGGIMHGSRLLTGAGYLLRVPAIDLAEVGAGGGSIVWRDAGGALQVGPRSAGASPGPLCYDLGGTEPTVTDANIVLGYLNPTALAGGAVKLNAARSHEIFQERVAEPLGLPPRASPARPFALSARPTAVTRGSRSS